MSMRQLLVVWIVALLLGLAAFASWRSHPTAEAAAARTAVHDVPIPVDDVTGLRIVRPGVDGGPALELDFTRTAAGWRQTNPFEVAADGFAIRQVVLAAADLVSTRRHDVDDLEASGGLARLGLDATATTVELAWPGGGTTLELGARTVAGRGWMRVEGADEVLVVDDTLHQRAIEDDPRNWRSRRLFPAENEIVEIRIVNGDDVTTLRRQGRRWRMQDPVETRVAGDAIDRILAVLGRVEHDGFVADRPSDPARFGLADPAAIMDVVRDDGTVERLLIGGPAGLVGRGRFAMVEGVPTVLRLDEPTLRGLLPAVATYIDPTGTGTDPADIRFLQIEATDGRIRLERDLDRWRISIDDGAAREVSGAQVDVLLSVLTSTNSNEIQLLDFPASLEVATIVLHGFDGRPIDAIRVARESGEGRWALENGDGVLRLLPRNTDIPLGRADWNP
ncbi:MAG: DUF4340 domain-containing protein [Planctomycetota bacterium]|nr:DUF4340 domain-containing protein [Planctomycetota bacterium]